jgi:hypothetical protein
VGRAESAGACVGWPPVWPPWPPRAGGVTYGNHDQRQFPLHCPAASRALSLAIRAGALADEIDALHRDIRAARDEPVRRAGFRCDTASGWMRQASTELQDTAGHLGHIAAAVKPGSCAVLWGVCPEHGNTPTSTGGKTWCRVIGCGRRWEYDRAGMPCIEPARWTVTCKQGHACVMCDGHALDARKRLEGARARLGEEFACLTG